MTTDHNCNLCCPICLDDTRRRTIAGLEAENRRLREALGYCAFPTGLNRDNESALRYSLDVARAALATEGDEG